MVTPATKKLLFILATKLGIKQATNDGEFVAFAARHALSKTPIDEVMVEWRAVLAKREAEKPKESLGEWSQEWLACTRCRLHRCREKVVLGRGLVPADVIVIGEAPGAEENRTGLPFVGPAGQLLNRALRILDQENVTYFITNDVGCFPGSGNKPSPTQSELCRERLLATVREVRPSVAMIVGGNPLFNILGLSPISELRGTLQWWEEVDLPVVPTWHPAGILRDADPQRMREFRSDVQKVAERAREMARIPF